MQAAEAAYMQAAGQGRAGRVGADMEALEVGLRAGLSRGGSGSLSGGGLG
eukprot:CAMPEP_0182534574 /NCGR_PEP_ID=MMETSP1323-20130603/16064_1 /TAXON_ID=236787 /ORGANISM="Florenciella parvula, Strain RCC1693" /LENGTH=49 /DNA_ID= /DNA_START= /DNA_END= /DNA_ORIENTATION=